MGPYPTSSLKIVVVVSDFLKDINGGGVVIRAFKLECNLELRHKSTIGYKSRLPTKVGSRIRLMEIDIR